MRAVWCCDELSAGGRVLVRGIAVRADASGVSGRGGGLFVPELSGETAPGGPRGRGAHAIVGIRGGCRDDGLTAQGLRDQSKRDFSTAWRDSFALRLCSGQAGANEEEKAAPLRSE
jgi:hypothetical protein